MKGHAMLNAKLSWRPGGQTGIWLLLMAMLLPGLEVVYAQNITYSPLYTTATFNAKTIDVNLPVGVVDGAHGVTPTGAATYTIPIKVAPGSNGMVPQIALAYNSQSGNGIAGMGWRISGISAITKGSKSLYYDQEVTPAVPESFGPLYLDGKRLLEGTTTTGGQVNEYFSEMEDGVQIQPQGLYGSNSYNWIKVIDKKGNISEYGNTSYSKLVSIGGDLFAWYLNKVTDEAGNYLQIDYDMINGEKVVSQILYTGNVNSGAAPYNKIRFIYKSRDDKNILFEKKTQLRQMNLLEKIEVYHEGVVFRTYELRYGFAEGYSFLKEVVETGANGAGLNATIFKYGDLNDDVTETNTNIPINGEDRFAGDFDGDGIGDIVLAQKSGAYHTGYKIYKGNASGTALQLYASGTFPPSEKSTIKALFGLKRFEVPINASGVFSSDFDLDGRDDIVRPVIRQDGTEFFLDKINIIHSTGNGNMTSVDYVMPANSAGWEIQPSRDFIVIGDYNGDKTPDMLVFVRDKSQNYQQKILFFSYRSGSYWELSSVNPVFDYWWAERKFAADMDGDGDTELFIQNENKLYVEKMNFTSTTSGNLIGLIDNTLPSTDMRIWSGDFNGDGKMDLVTFDKSASKWAIGYANDYDGSNNNSYLFKDMFSNGSLPQNFYSEAREYDLGSGPQPFTDHIFIGDFDGDGKADFMHEYLTNINGPLQSQVHLYYSKGINNWILKSYLSPSMFSFGALTMISDLNGDNRSDIFTVDAAVTNGRILNFKPNGTDKLLHKVKDGMGKVTEFSHVPLNRGAGVMAYGAMGNTVAVKPLPVWGVNKVTDQMGLPGIAEQVYEYTYQNALIHTTGKGFLGYRYTTSKDVNKSILRENELAIDITGTAFNYLFWPDAYILPYLKTITDKSVANNQQLSQTVFTQDLTKTTIGGQYKNKRARLNQEIATITDLLSGAITVTTKQYDAYCNLTLEQQNINNGLEINQSSFSYTAIGNMTTPSKPLLIQMTRTRNGSPSVTTSRLNTYYASGQLYRFTEHYGLPDAVLHEYSYQQNGQPNVEVISAAGMTPKFHYWTWDNYGRFPIEKTNTLGKTEYYNYDTRWGVVTSYKGFDLNTTTYQYDAFGRLLQTNFPEGYSAIRSIFWNSIPSINAVYSIGTVTPGKPKEQDDFDALGRLTREGKAAATINLGDITFPLYSYVEKTYDDRGNISSETAPHYSTENNYLTTTYAYDNLNRPSSVCDLLHCTTNTYSYANGESTITATQSSGQVKSRITDASGKTIKVTDNGGTLFFSYDSWGNQSLVRNTGLAQLVVNDFDAYNRKIQTKDINAGIYKYTYDAYGRMISEENPKNQVHNYTYDMLDQVLTISGPEGTITNTYANATVAGEGFKLKKAQDFNGKEENYTYDNYGRLVQLTKGIGANTYTSSYSYNTYGHMTGRTFPGNINITNEYNQYGKWVAVKNGAQYLYRIISFDGRGHTLTAERGNGKTSTFTYDYGKYLTSITAPGVQDYTLNYDYLTGNITSRWDNIKLVNDAFTYDMSDRLTGTTTAPGPGPLAPVPLTVSYQNVTGNISQKGDVGTYTYGAKLNAVTYVSNAQSLIPTKIQDITYTPFLMTDKVTESGWQASFTYDHRYNRVKSEMTFNGSLNEARTYAQDGYEIHELAGNRKDVQYIPGPDGVCQISVQQTIAGSGSEVLYYPYADHLGSMVTLTDVNGQIVYEQSFDPWGRRRNPVDWGYANIPAATGFEWLRGFTGHEHLPEFGLINMNARMYDPLLGRMLAPDKYVQQPENTQSYNRYSYCINNPMKYTDPSGNLFHEFINGHLNGFFSRSGSYSDRMHYGWMQARSKIDNSGKIIAGQFAGNFGQIMSRHLWQTFQNGVGLTFSLAFNLWSNDTKVEHFDGATVISSSKYFLPSRATTYSSYIIGNEGLEAKVGNDLFMHEYGHYIQSQKSGPLYLYKYGLPSALTGMALVGFSGNHDDFWVERDANSRAYDYFRDKYSYTNWDDWENPRGDVYNVKWWEPFAFAIDPLSIVRANKGTPLR